MISKSYKNLKEAIESTLKPDVEHHVVTHKLPKGFVIGKHYHPKAHEWVIADSGSFEFFYEKKWHTIKPAKNDVKVISVPPKTIHDLKSSSSTTYIVIRDRKAEYVFI
jgi:quercetin dioxygenase-like cupin family protein